LIKKTKKHISVHHDVIVIMTLDVTQFSFFYSHNHKSWSLYENYVITILR